MKSYSEIEIFSPSAVGCMQIALRTVNRLRDDLRCHEVARIVQRVLQQRNHFCRVIDGHYGPVDHSWLLIHGAQENNDLVILDPYAVGRLPTVQLVSTCLGLHELYREGEERKDIQHEIIEEQLSYWAGRS